MVPWLQSYLFTRTAPSSRNPLSSALLLALLSDWHHRIASGGRLGFIRISGLILLIEHWRTVECTIQNVAYLCSLQDSGPRWGQHICFLHLQNTSAEVHANQAFPELSPRTRRTSCTLWLQTGSRAHRRTHCCVKRHRLPIRVELTSPTWHSCYPLGQDSGLYSGQGIKQMFARRSHCPLPRTSQACLRSDKWDVCTKLITLLIFSFSKLKLYFVNPNICKSNVLAIQNNTFSEMYRYLLETDKHTRTM